MRDGHAGSCRNNSRDVIFRTVAFVFVLMFQLMGDQLTLRTRALLIKKVLVKFDFIVEESAHHHAHDSSLLRIENSGLDNSIDFSGVSA